MDVRTGKAPARERVFTPVIDQHASWIAVNPVQGCPKRCAYCFLNERSQTGTAPVQVAAPAETLGMLLASPFYGPERAVAFFTWTDVMAIASSRAYLGDLLERMTAAALPNPVVLITKCRVPDGLIAAISRARAGGLRVIVYLSYSGLGSAIEMGVRHEQLVANFPALAAAGIPVVHYWRPAFPVSATTETMTRVLDLAAAHATCTMAAGLKVEAEAVERLSGIWPGLADTPGVTRAEGVYPAAFWNFIHRTEDLHPGYPVFHANSCALAYVLGAADRFGIFGSDVCTARNRCPAPQRHRCGDAFAAVPPATGEQIVAALAGRNLENTPFTFDPAKPALTLEAVIPNAVTSALTQDLGVRVVSAGQGGDRYWSSGTSGARPLVIGERS